jgi:hypothetical protein
MHLNNENSGGVRAYVDASFLTHQDGYGHTGTIICVLGTPVYFSSKKQGCLSRSSTAAELIMAQTVVNMANFMEG